MFYFSSFYLCQLSYILYGLKECWLSIWLQLNHFILKHLDMWLTMICTCGLNILVVRQIYPHSHTTQLKILIPKPERLKPIERENSNAPMAPIHPSHTLTSKPHQWPEIGKCKTVTPTIPFTCVEEMKHLSQRLLKHQKSVLRIANQLKTKRNNGKDFWQRREEKLIFLKKRNDWQFQSLERELVASFLF